MNDNFENDENNQLLINNQENPFISFMENYYGTFKKYLNKKELSNIGKINKKLMSLVIIDIGHNLYKQKNEKKEKMKNIIKNNNILKKEVKDDNKNDKSKVKEFLDSNYIKRIFTYLKRKEYIEAFKSVEPTVNNKLLEIYKLLYIILNNEKMVNLFDGSKAKFWKKMTDEFVIKSFDGENLSKYLYKLLLEKLTFEPEYVFKINYIWKNNYENEYDVKEITGESPTTGLFFLIIKAYLEKCGIIESKKSDQFISCSLLKLDILNIDEKIIKTANFYKRINYI